MAKQKLRKKIEEEVKKSVLSYAVYRPESALVIAMTIIFSVFSLIFKDAFPIQWWIWLIFGVIGESLIILSTLKDEKFYQQIVEEIFQKEFDIKKLRDSSLQKKLNKALEYRELIVKEIEREEDAVLDDYLFNMVGGLEDWISQLYHLGQGLDIYLHDSIINRDMESVPQELERFKRLLAKEKEETVKKELQRTIAAKESQWNTLQNLRQTMARAELQIDNTIAAMGTVYSQVVLLSAKELDSKRAQGLQADMTEQVHALEDVSAAMDEVYQMSN